MDNWFEEGIKGNVLRFLKIKRARGSKNMNVPRGTFMFYAFHLDSLL
jgi:hypothetical protein